MSDGTILETETMLFFAHLRLISPMCNAPWFLRFGLAAQACRNVGRTFHAPFRDLDFMFVIREVQIGTVILTSTGLRDDTYCHYSIALQNFFSELQLSP